MKHRKSSYLIIGIILVLTGLIISNFLLADIKFSPFADKKAIYFPSIEAYYDTCSIGLNNQYLYIKADTFIGDLQGKADEAYNSDSLGGNYWTGYLLSTAQDTFTYIIGDSTSVEKVEADIGDIDSLWTSNIYMSDGGIIAQAGGASMQIGLASDYIYEAYLNNLYTYNVAVSESLSAPSIYTDTIQDGFYLKGGLVGNGYILLGGAISTEAGQDITSGGKMFSSDDITCDNNIYGDALINNANNPLEVRADVSLSDSVCLRIVYDTDSITGDTMGNLRVSGKTYFDGDSLNITGDVVAGRNLKLSDTLWIGDEWLTDVGSYIQTDYFNATYIQAQNMTSNGYVRVDRLINNANVPLLIDATVSGYNDSIPYKLKVKNDSTWIDTFGNERTTFNKYFENYIGVDGYGEIQNHILKLVATDSILPTGASAWYTAPMDSLICNTPDSATYSVEGDSMIIISKSGAYFINYGLAFTAMGVVNNADVGGRVTVNGTEKVCLDGEEHGDFIDGGSATINNTCIVEITAPDTLKLQYYVSDVNMQLKDGGIHDESFAVNLTIRYSGKW
jgi:hypothetical protein